MGGFAFFAGGGFGPGFLETDVDGGVDDGAAVYLCSREEHEFAFVVDAFGGQFRFVVVVHVYAA